MASANAALLQEAIGLHRQGAVEEAIKRYGQILKDNPADSEALYMMAMASCQRGQFAGGVEFARRALASKPDEARTHNLLGMALSRLGRPAEALASLDNAIAADPGFAEAHGNRANTLCELDRKQEAIASYDRAVTLRPDSLEDRFNRGVALHELNRHEEAIRDFEHIIAADPALAAAHLNRANILAAIKRFGEALESYEDALDIEPRLIEALINRANTLNELGRNGEALVAIEQAIAAKPDNADLWFNRGRAEVRVGRYETAINSYRQSLAIDPGHKQAPGALAHCYLETCDWGGKDAVSQLIRGHVTEQRSVIHPLTFMMYSDDPAEHLRCAQHYAASKKFKPVKPAFARSDFSTERLKLAYVSSDFRSHAVGNSIVQLIETHDREKFEIIGISHGIDDGSDVRARFTGAFDQFHDVRSLTDSAIADLMKALRVNVAVDLNNHTQFSRPGILAHRPAPVQAVFLGFPGTMGVDFVDYFIADRVVLPFSQQRFYSERIVHLPDCYHAKDSSREISAKPLSRKVAGLPDNAFVFCCFNNHYKITREMFDIWTRLLKAVDGSVLWLSRANEWVVASLRDEAAVRDIDPGRLVFAPRLDRLEDHLARHQLADLFLDALPYNAHTTACDALWAGLPVLTCAGNTLAGRVCGSFLHAAGLPELVMESLDAYEDLALKLAREPAMLRSIREKLAANRLTNPLFDAERYRRNIEAAYRTMWDIWQSGEPPRSFAVDPNSA